MNEFTLGIAALVVVAVAGLVFGDKFVSKFWDLYYGGDYAKQKAKEKYEKLAKTKKAE